MKLQKITEGMPSGVIRMKSNMSKMNREEQFEYIKRVGASKNLSTLEYAKRLDRLFANKNKQLERMVADMEAKEKKE